MKEKRVQSLPNCDFRNLAPTGQTCTKAEYDAPCKAGSGSSWAFMCQAHYEMFAQKGADTIGFKLVEGIAEPKKDGKVIRGIEPGLDDLEYWEDALFNDREVKCSGCGELKRVEPDADYVYTCEGCGARVKCPMPPI